MSLVNSIGAALVAAGKFVGRFAWGSKLGCYLDEYEAAALASGSTITMFTPKKGEKFAGTGQLAWDDLSDTDTVTLAVGIAGAVDKFLAATAAHTAADKADLDAGAAAIAALGYEFDGLTPVIITTAGNSAATGTIKLKMDMILCN
jgi:hypothetical protein